MVCPRLYFCKRCDWSICTAALHRPPSSLGGLLPSVRQPKPTNVDIKKCVGSETRTSRHAAQRSLETILGVPKMLVGELLNSGELAIGAVEYTQILWKFLE